MGDAESRLGPSNRASLKVLPSALEVLPSRNRRATAGVHVISHWRILRQVLVFRETSLFTRQVVQKLTDSEYLELQAALILQPELGDLIPDSGGLRKLRCGAATRQGEARWRSRYLLLVCTSITRLLVASVFKNGSRRLVG